jgi:hypothetical protein
MYAKSREYKEMTFFLLSGKRQQKHYIRYQSYLQILPYRYRYTEKWKNLLGIPSSRFSDRLLPGLNKKIMVSFFFEFTVPTYTVPVSAQGFLFVIFSEAFC